MEPVEVVLLLVIGIAIGLVPVVSLVFPRTKKNLSTQYEDRYRAKYETWKASYQEEEKKHLEVQVEAAKEEVVDGSICQKDVLASLPQEISRKFAAADLRVIGTPTDYVVFKNLNKVTDAVKDGVEIVFLVNLRNAGLTENQKAVKAAIEARKVRFEVFNSPTADKGISKNAVITKRYSSDGRTVA